MSQVRTYAPRVASLAAGVLLAAGLARCEYTTDGDMAPTVAKSPHPSSPLTGAPLPIRDPEIVATEARNMAGLDRILAAAQPDGIVLGGAGGIGGAAGDGASGTSTQVTEAGSYTVTAACVGGPDAQLNVSQDVLGGRSSLLELKFGCGAATQQVVQLETGSVTAHVMRYNGGSAAGTGAVAGVRVRLETPAQ